MAGGVKFLIRSPAEHHLRGFPSLAVKLIWTCVGLPFMEQEAAGSVFPQHASAQRKGVRGCATLATLEMKTHGENNKLICCMKRTIFFFLLSAQSPRMTPLLWAEEEAAMKTPPPPSSSGERHTNAHVVSVLRPSLTFNGLQIMTVEFGCFHWLMQFQQIVLNRLIYMHPLFPYPCIFFLLRIEIIKTGMK